MPIYVAWSEILAACCGLPPQTVPEQAVALSCGIDVQLSGFWSVVRAWAPDLTSRLIHYGFLATWDGRCYAHTDNIDEFFRTITRSSARNLPDDVVMGDEGA